MKRPEMPEWQPGWFLHGDSVFAIYFVISAAIYFYTLLRGSSRRFPGVLITGMLLVATAKAHKVIPFYALAWAFHVPATFACTALARRIEESFDRNARRIGVVAVVVAGILLAGFLTPTRWWPVIPGEVSSSIDNLCFPVGPVEYLKRIGFRGNLMNFFPHGGYISWKLYPNVKVSVDSRYEVAYAAQDVDRNFALFRHGTASLAGELQRLPRTDLILIDTRLPVARQADQLRGWTRVYVDRTFALYSRPGLELPKEDRNGQRIVGSFE
jgi:hypothetical protein